MDRRVTCLLLGAAFLVLVLGVTQAGPVSAQEDSLNCPEKVGEYSLTKSKGYMGEVGIDYPYWPSPRYQDDYRGLHYAICRL